MLDRVRSGAFVDQDRAIVCRSPSSISAAAARSRPKSMKRRPPRCTGWSRPRPRWLADISNLVGRERQLQEILEAGHRGNARTDRLQQRTEMSACVNTPTTPGTAAAAAVSMLRMRPCGHALRNTRRVQHPFQMDVIDIPAGAGQEPHVFAPRNRLADVHRHDASRKSREASRIASTTLAKISCTNRKLITSGFWLVSKGQEVDRPGSALLAYIRVTDCIGASKPAALDAADQEDGPLEHPDSGLADPQRVPVGRWRRAR